MSQLSLVRYSYLAYLSQPASDRPIYKLLRQHPVRKIVELGVGDAVRTRRMIEMALASGAETEIRYTGIDQFEARPSNQPGMSLKAAFKLLRQMPIKSHLIPGDPFAALARAANDLAGTDLLIIAADQDREPLARAWSFVPRMLHDRSLVLLERSTKGHPSFDQLSRSEIDALTGASKRQMRAA